MIITPITYEADGLVMRGQFFAQPNVPAPVPGVLVFPEAFGLGEHALSRAERLAQMGYAALACDLHGEAMWHDDINEAMALLDPIRRDSSRIRARGVAALDVLKMQEGVDANHTAAIGFCFGGTMALELARSGADICAAVGFHSGLATVSPQDASNIVAKVLVCLGADDPAINAQHRAAFEDEMRQGGVDWQMQIYGGVVHSFTNPAADARGRPEFLRYDALADARSWKAMQILLDEVFG